MPSWKNDGTGTLLTSRMRTLSREERDRGFTLIELLVVIVVIGILAGIAIPVFLGQRVKAVDGSLRADLKNLALAADTYAVENPYATFYGANAVPTNESVTLAIGSTSAVEFRKSEGNEVQIGGSPRDGYCLRARNDSGSMGTAPDYFWYDSKAGGLVPGPPSATSSPVGGVCGSTAAFYSVS